MGCREDFSGVRMSEILNICFLFLQMCFWNVVHDGLLVNSFCLWQRCAGTMTS